MNEAAHTWRDLLIQRSTRTFTGRDDILEHFRLNCLDTVPRDLILLLQGIPGAGKSTTLARLREVALGYGIFSTCIDSSLATPVRDKAILHAMCGIAEQFSARGTPLTQFEERYHEYIAALQRITADPHAPGRIFDAIGGFHDRDAWYNRSWDSYLKEKFPANTWQLIRQPVEQLTALFVHDLNTWALVKRILLCFDDWEVLDAQLGAWLRDIMLKGVLNIRIWVLLASENPLTPEWDSLMALIRQHTLAPFTEVETQTYLRGLGITDRQRVADIIVFSNGLPVLANLLSSAREGKAGDLALSPLDRYLKWLNRAQRRVVLLASAARIIDASVLDAILGKEGDLWFGWLQVNGLLVKKDGVWIYHPLLRAQFLAWGRREMYEATYAAHVALRSLYLRAENGEDAAVQFPLERTAPAAFEATYHGLMIGESGAIRTAVLEFLGWLRRDFTRAGELVETWKQAAGSQENANAVVEWAEALGALWGALYEHNYETAAAVCEAVLAREALDAEVSSAVTRLHMAIEARFPQPALDPDFTPVPSADAVPEPPVEALQSVGQAEVPEVVGDGEPGLSDSPAAPAAEPETAPSALPEEQEDKSASDVPAPDTVDAEPQTEPVQSLPDQRRGAPPDCQTAEACWQTAEDAMKEGAYAEALDAYALALEMDATLTKAHFGRAAAFTQLGDMDSAIACYTAALEAEPKHVQALRNRGWLYMRQQQYRQAVGDYTAAVSLDPEDATLVYARANAYYRSKDYAHALQDYDEVIRRAPAFTEAYVSRGVTHAVLQEYRRAIADFNQAITLEPDNGYAYHRRGRAYTRLQQLSLAHHDFARASTLLPRDVGVHIDMGLLYTKQGEYGKALDAYHQAMRHDPGNATAHYNAACTAALQGDVVEACRSLDTAIGLHPPYRKMAASDADFAGIRDTAEFQKRVG